MHSHVSPVVQTHPSSFRCTQKKSSEVLQTSVQSVIGEELWSKIQSVDPLRDLRPLRRSEFWFTTPGGAKQFLGFSVSPLLDKEDRLTERKQDSPLAVHNGFIHLFAILSISLRYETVCGRRNQGVFPRLLTGKLRSKMTGVMGAYPATVEKSLICRALEKTEGNETGAAELWRKVRSSGFSLRGAA